ncbi:MAG: type IV toxin-antitoxin system AbiEi family antitoxin domain-containing protein [Bdellovibrionaceae bacterium]|nr:type IV toxin-antitoxin system AbiEi family antitoxin domain-containing protein [Pseudobdellovibrionaceae bacterium]
MTPAQEAKLKKLGPFTLEQAKAIGISHQELSRLVKEEKIHRMERGIYLHPKAKAPREIDFQIACTKFGPASVVGGLTALSYYNLANQVPQQTWILVSPEQRTSSKGYRLIRTKTPLNVGVIQGNGFRIVSIERAIAEGFKLASKIGERTAIKAARIAIQQKQTTLKKIGVMAKELGLDAYLTKYFEAIIGAIEG